MSWTSCGRTCGRRPPAHEALELRHGVLRFPGRAWMRTSNCADSNRHPPFPWFPRVPFVRSRRREAGRARDYPRGSRVSTGRAPSSPSSTFIVRYAGPHGQHLRFSFSMISPSNFAEERAPRLSAMGGRAGCNPDNPLKLPTKSRLLAARGSKMPNFGPPSAVTGHYPP